jgi:hypothetical protein
MENSPNKEQILKFLNKSYFVKENLILDKYENQHWGNEILKKLPIIFSIDNEYCENVFGLWCSEHGIENFVSHLSFKPKQLKITWNPELAQEITINSGFDAESELIGRVTEQITKEIDAQILRDLIKLVTPDEFLDVVKCLGYNNLTMYDPQTFKPSKVLMSMKKQDIEYERHNNTHWQDWIRAREQDKKT